ncbi:hypothetical protein EAW52_23885 [Pseudomonas sp. LTJR-52]|uniref:hypothetical protein n=1 Tax=Pseudomonas sp. LTJR-52 TaxID=2479392 RepID=UPI000EFAA9BC|nr:hypothetical protein [Pseudomonas sp. LTJR-52]AYN96758.1 hypothetical protein EAW52_23885 [Pseudomonas sp. LTJR-52]
MKHSALSIGITLLLASVAIHADNNIAEQYQDGTGLKSSLTQTGSDNYSLQRQEGGRYDTIETSQVGTGNRATALQNGFGEGNIQIDQNGAANQAMVQQQPGSESYTAANGGSISQAGSGNLSEVTQGGIQNYAQSLQSGDNNEHTVMQDGYLNYASLASYGDNNRISVSTLPNTLPMGNSVDAIQVGNANTAVVEQSGTGAYIRTRQEGNGNTVEALQRNESDSLAPDAIVSIYGSDNRLTIDQNGASRMEAYLDGNSNSVNVRQERQQTGSASSLLTDVIGSNNSIDVSQVSNELSLPSRMTITQRGDELDVTARQDNTSSGNLEVFQSGSLGVATVQQSGIYNEARLVQNGMANSASITQQ